MREEVLNKIHEGHQGLSRCRKRAQTSVWWPGLTADLKKILENCEFCRENKRAQRRDPLKPSPLPDRPWQRLGMDLCVHRGKNYLVVSDYFSKYLEILHLSVTTADQVLQKLKAVFARFGIPDTIHSDNRPQFACETFKAFSAEFGFEHITSSPHHPSGNGHAERAVQTAKRILQQKDPLLALMSFRATPTTATGVSPAELLMGRRIRTTLPTLESNLVPQWPDLSIVQLRNKADKERQAFYFNRRHGARELSTLRPGDNVLVKIDSEKRWSEPAVVQESATPRAYVIQSPSGGGQKQRNRRHLQILPRESVAGQSADPETQPGLEEKCEHAPNMPDRQQTQPQTQTVTRAGRVCKLVKRLNL